MSYSGSSGGTCRNGVFFLVLPNESQLYGQNVPVHSNVPAVSPKTRCTCSIVRLALLLMRGRRSGRSPAGYCRTAVEVGVVPATRSSVGRSAQHCRISLAMIVDLRYSGNDNRGLLANLLVAAASSRPLLRAACFREEVCARAS